MTGSAENGWEIRISRFIAAPPARVWRAMTEQIEDWWCPKPWQARIVVQEWRTGGRSAMVFHGPNGEQIPQEGIFLEVTPGVRFVSTDAIRAGHMPGEPFMIGLWEIAAEGNGTRYTALARHWSEANYRSHLEMGFEAGWGAAADQLAALCEGDPR